MKQISVRLKITTFSLLSSLVLIILGDVWLENEGLPQRYRYQVQEILSRSGLNWNVGRINIGISHGFVLRDVSLRDPSLNGREIARFGQVRLEPDWLLLISDGTFLVETFRLKEGRVMIPLEKGLDARELIITDIGARITESGPYYTIEESRLQVGQFIMNAKGSVYKAHSDDDEDSPMPDLSGIMQLSPYLEKLSPQQREKLFAIIDFSERASGSEQKVVDFDFLIDPNDPTRNM